MINSVHKVDTSVCDFSPPRIDLSLLELPFPDSGAGADSTIQGDVSNLGWTWAALFTNLKKEDFQGVQ